MNSQSILETKVVEAIRKRIGKLKPNSFVKVFDRSDSLLTLNSNGSISFGSRIGTGTLLEANDIERILEAVCSFQFPEQWQDAVLADAEADAELDARLNALIAEHRQELLQGLLQAVQASY